MGFNNSNLVIIIESSLALGEFILFGVKKKQKSLTKPFKSQMLWLVEMC